MKSFLRTIFPKKATPSRPSFLDPARTSLPGSGAAFFHLGQELKTVLAPAYPGQALRGLVACGLLIAMIRWWSKRTFRAPEGHKGGQTKRDGRGEQMALVALCCPLCRGCATCQFDGIGDCPLGGQAGGVPALIQNRSSGHRVCRGPELPHE